MKPVCMVINRNYIIKAQEVGRKVATYKFSLTEGTFTVGVILNMGLQPLPDVYIYNFDPYYRKENKDPPNELLKTTN